MPKIVVVKEWLSQVGLNYIAAKKQIEKQEQVYKIAKADKKEDEADKKR